MSLQFVNDFLIDKAARNHLEQDAGKPKGEAPAKTLNDMGKLVTLNGQF